MLKCFIKLASVSALLWLIIFSLSPRTFPQSLSLQDTTITLAIKPLEAKVYASPEGDIIGKIKRGRVINVLESNQEWLMFTTWDYPIGWLKSQDAVTLEEWKRIRNTFLTDSVKAELDAKFKKVIDTPIDEISNIKSAIVKYDSLVKALDIQINSRLERILSFRDSIAQGRLPAKKGVKMIEAERAVIESCFSQMMIGDKVEVLQEAKSAMENKHQAINSGLQYLMRFILSGKPEDANFAGYHFQLAQNAIDEYSRIIFQVKTEYGLYKK